ncbi:MAG: T9SS type A sorting domain-containing protein, partial [Bacteroidetes bacterium]|nr:T9SS type A sorting domain-containing protein [Bacteroidota bacterium]
TTGGLTYQWASATSSVGPYTAISGATLSSYTTPPLAPSSNWYNCVITCTAGPASTTASPVQITAVGTVTNPIPYAEGFESISSNNMLPNCTWTTTSTGTICLTYMSATGSWNQIPHTGSKYASFRYGTNPSGDYFYSNGIALTAGQTYSANVFYITDGSTGWSDFEIMYGAAQTATALTSITATTGVVTNTAYVGLGGTFTPTLSGIYYVAIKCIGAFAPMYLSFDDISVIALPACTGAPASNTIIASSSPACPGSSVTLNLANTYTVAGLTYQWASSTSSVGPFSAISGATQNYYVIPTATATTWYNVVVTCTAASGSVSVSPSQVAVLAAPIYTTTPFLETFDNTWQNRCDNHNVPVAACWSSTPTTGNNSWRRQDDGATALWIGSYGTVTPIGVGSADFNSYEASSGMQGALDLYINLNSSATYTMSFYHINTSGTDSLEVFLSTNGGSTFTKKAGYTISSAWNKKTLLLSGVSSPTCVVRFQATSDWGVTDIGVDSVQFIAPCVTPTISLTASTSSFCIGGSSTLSITGAASSYSWSTGVSATQSIVVSPTVNTVYTATASNGSGCSATQSIAITILPPLTLTVTSSSPSLCAGYSATISASGASNYTWTPGGLTSSVIAISPTSNSSYTVFGASGTCTGQAVSSISVSPSPTITTITSHSICQGNIGATSFSIAALGASTYSWYAPVNSSNFQVTIVNPTVTTVYTVAAVSANGCKSVGTATMLVVNCTGIAQNSTNENAVTLFPNPVNDVFTVVLQNASENMHIQLFDASGKMILNHSLKLGNTTISLKDFAPGVYSYNVISTDSKQIIKNGKLIKQ